ncbi:PLP-dependent aminotransferase family protein [Maritimibacter sp. 55A14]|uniref:MocR-like pyridoxine biosynthesis transcription factor PdxR n=1 Tax=Maritimibacter sp. 55A14 TaxID=2174844 RepID=UPI000D61FF75|nr:PLP-dependent aminotransferase family protein [Maritimibacter sp. 55A14]PWE32449.1 PLP-dependent aminotransferase family protein [Maritimibacter sp. 55A14]
MTNSALSHNTNLDAALLGITLDRGGGRPLHAQLAQALRRLILSGRAASGARLPASRRLAAELGVSRITALAALDQLVAEGYLETRRGAGTFVAGDLPHIATPEHRAAQGPAPGAPAPLRPFHPGLPDLAGFPHAAWARHLDQSWRNPEPALLAVPDPMGWAPLRNAIAAHLDAWRGIACAGGQVIVTSGAAEAFALIAQSMREPGAEVLVEEPGFAPMRRALAEAGLACRPCPVDCDGFDIAAAEADHPDARAAVVTPSRHYPYGMTLPLPRRLALLDWAARRDAWVVEDDYDSEFRYRGAPLPALMSLDTGGRTLYVGSFSKLLSPALRLGYLVAPPRLLPALRAALDRRGAQASLTPQPALARFMASGEFAVHLRRMRRVYAQRQDALRAAITAEIPDLLIAPPDPSGMHLVAGLGPALAGRVHDREIAAAAQEAGLTLRALSAYATGPGARQGLVLGYAAFDEAALRDAVARLARVIRRLAAA